MDLDNNFNILKFILYRNLVLYRKMDLIIQEAEREKLHGN